VCLCEWCETREIKNKIHLPIGGGHAFYYFVRRLHIPILPFDGSSLWNTQVEMEGVGGAWMARGQREEVGALGRSNPEG